MPRRSFNDGQEIVFGDLSAINSASERELYDRVIYELLNRQTDVVFGDGFGVNYLNGTQVTVNAGSGFQTDGAQVDPEPTKRLLYNAALATKTLTAPDATNPRIDIVCIKAQRATSTSESRRFKDATSGAVTTSSMVVETDWLADILVVTGTPAGSPAVPATPAGYIKVAELAVAAVTGLASQASVTDKRPVFQKASSRGDYATKTGNYTLTQTDEIVYFDCTGGNYIATLPAASTMSGRILRVGKIDGSANTLTITPNGADTISGEASQVVDQRWTVLALHSIGSGWVLL